MCSCHVFWSLENLCSFRFWFCHFICNEDELLAVGGCVSYVAIMILAMQVQKKCKVTLQIWSWSIINGCDNAWAVRTRGHMTGLITCFQTEWCLLTHLQQQASKPSGPVLGSTYLWKFADGILSSCCLLVLSAFLSCSRQCLSFRTVLVDRGDMCFALGLASYSVQPQHHPIYLE